MVKNSLKGKDRIFWSFEDRSLMFILGMQSLSKELVKPKMAKGMVVMFLVPLHQVVFKNSGAKDSTNGQFLECDTICEGMIKFADPI